MSFRKFFLWGCLLWLSAAVHAQTYSTAYASITTEVFFPIGAEQSGGMVRAVLRAGTESSTFSVGPPGFQVGVSRELHLPESSDVPEFQVLSGNQYYGLMVEIEPFLFRPSHPEDRIRVEATQLETVGGNAGTGEATDRYSIGTRLSLAANQPPGLYVPAQPCRVTVYFN